MNMNKMASKVGGAALMLAMTFAFTIAASGTAQAQWRDRDNYGYQDQVRWSRDRTRQYAYTLGYHNAYTEGKEASERGYRGSYNNMPGYRNSDNGWKTWMGYQSDYRNSYRSGYQAGFNDGRSGRSRRYDRQDVERILGGDLERVYEGNDRWGRNRDNDRWGDRGRWNDRNQIAQIAQQNGYTDGNRRGQDDANRRRGFNYNDDSEYRNAMRGYRSEFGDRGMYQQAYREGFRRGYEDGYRNRGSNTRRFPWPF